jgi:hypothetical protein
MTATPRLHLSGTADHTDPPAPVTDAEIGALVELAGSLGARAVAIGHGRHETACENGERFARAWQRTGGSVLARVSWPEDAASWLRQAKRLTTPAPDLWALGGAASGLAQMVRRLSWSTSWSPHRTIGIGNTISRAHRLAGAGLLDGMRGAHPDGQIWQITAGQMRNLRLATMDRSTR